MQTEIELPFDLALPESVHLTAGELTCMYESGSIRYIRLGKTELVRKIYGAVRKGNWDTVPFKISDEKITKLEGGFTISYTALYGLETGLYKADFLIEGKPDNSIAFSMKGIALEHFQRNRIGICVLHPIKECTGRMASVTRPDGTCYESMFPGPISPVPPFMDIHKLEWRSANGVTVRYSFDGDIFETEDQRNWSDSSYKTYSTPSSLPKPVDVNPGDVINQKVSLEVSGTGAKMQDDTITEIKESKVAFPQIGYGRSVNTPAFNQEIVDRLLQIPFDLYRVPVFMKSQEWEHNLITALEEARQVNTRLELIVYSGGNNEGEVNSLTTLLKNKQLLVKSILFVGEDGGFIPKEVLKKLYPVLKADLAAVKIGYGADAAFADLNQNPPGDEPFDFISFGLNPQAHTFDNLSILENLQSQHEMLQSAQSLAKGKPVIISPITLNDRNLPGDDRQYSSLAAFWTLMALQNFSEAYSITVYELFGAAGLLETRGTDLVKTSATYEALAALCQFQPAWIIKRYAGNNLLMDGLLVENESGERLFFKPPPEYILR